MKAKKNVQFLVSVSVASAALMGSLPAKAEVRPSETAITQRITLPENAILKPADQSPDASTLQHVSHSSHASHASHSSHDSHSSHSSGM
jgi:hypothetical protein